MKFPLPRPEDGPRKELFANATNGRSVVGALEVLKTEQELEEEELDRVYSLGFSGPEFEAYANGLKKRIAELEWVRSYLLDLLFNDINHPTNVTIREVRRVQRDPDEPTP